MNRPLTPVILDHVSAGYDAQDVIRDVTLSVEHNDFVGIVGPNGGGKTTLIKVVLGLISPSKGEIKVFGRAPKKARPFIGYVPQEVHFDRRFPIDVWNVVLMGRYGRGGWLRRCTSEDHRIVSHVLDLVGLIHLKNRPIGELSGGERQRVLVARALCAKPKILILDEPTANIDNPTSIEIYRLLEDLNKQTTIIIISHDIGAISPYVNKLVLLNKRIIYENCFESEPGLGVIQDSWKHYNMISCAMH